jgi:hypothetical protein
MSRLDDHALYPLAFRNFLAVFTTFDASINLQNAELIFSLPSIRPLGNVGLNRG